ncbi:MAG: DUF5317 domain-containing protein [Clostridiales bacterium]|nr:DUF5317 domain-containing protein [Clostridiales bacterium]
MILAVAVIFALLAVVALGGSFSSLRSARLQHEVWLPVGVGVQVLGPRLSPESPFVAALTWVLGGLIVIAVSFANRRVFGFWLVGLGVMCNAAVILLNGGMPVSVAALGYLGVYDSGELFSTVNPMYHPADAGSVLTVLADVLPIPGPALMRTVVSLGDVLLMVGVVSVILEMSGASGRFGRFSRTGMRAQGQ